MSATLTGRYFFPGSARFVSARASLQETSLRFEDGSGVLLAEAPLDRLKISDRLGNLPRRFVLGDGSCFETDDNEAADLITKGYRKHRSWLHRLENSWRWAGASVLLAALAAYLFVIYGIPASAHWLAQQTPPSVNAVIARQALFALEGALLSPTELTAAESSKAQALFSRVAALGARGPNAYRLLLRGSKAIGPNALALPDGTIVITDELWRMVRTDDEIEGVFAHEISHVDRSHSLQGLYQAALVPAAIALITGDLSQMSQLATILPGILVQAAYSRGLEQEADDDALIALRRLGANPANLADLLERMEKQLCQKTGCPPSWLGTYPETSERVLRFRRAGSAAKENAI